MHIHVCTYVINNSSVAVSWLRLLVTQTAHLLQLIGPKVIPEQLQFLCVVGPTHPLRLVSEGKPVATVDHHVVLPDDHRVA